MLPFHEREQRLKASGAKCGSQCRVLSGTQSRQRISRVCDVLDYLCSYKSQARLVKYRKIGSFSDSWRTFCDFLRIVNVAQCLI